MALHQPTGRSRLGFALAALTMLLWGILPLALKQALRSLDAVTITWFRFGVASLVLGAFLAGRGRLPALGRLGRRGFALLAVAVVGLAANFLAFLVGLDLTTPANAQVLIQLAPMLLGLGSLAVFGERYTPAQWLGLAVLAGGLLAFFSSQLGQLSAAALPTDRYVLGSGLLVVAAVTWAGYGLAQKQLLRALPSQALMLCIYVGCFLCFAPGAVPSAIPALSAADLWVLLFCAANTLVAYGAFRERAEPLGGVPRLGGALRHAPRDARLLPRRRSALPGRDPRGARLEREPRRRRRGRRRLAARYARRAPLSRASAVAVSPTAP